MNSEPLHSMSVVVLVFGLFLAAAGAVGLFFFGKEADRSHERQQLVVLGGLAERVGEIQSDQAELHERVALLDRKVSAAPLVSAAPAEKPVAPAVPPAVAAGGTPVREPAAEIQAEKLPPIAAGPRKAEPKPAKPAPSAPQVARRAIEKARPAPPVKVVRQPASSDAKTSKPAVDAPRKSAQPGSKHSLTEMQRARLIKRLRAHPHFSIVIRAEAGDARAVEMSTALRAAFHDAGWSVPDVQLDPKRAPFPGISLSSGTFPPPKEFVAAYGALEAAGLRVASDLNPRQPENSVVLSVGAHR